MNGYWLAIIVVGIGTLCLRLSFVAGGERIKMPIWFRRAIAFVPPAVLASLVAPAFFRGGPEQTLNPQQALTAVAAAFVAWRFRSDILTIGVGLALFYFLGKL